MQWWNIYKDDNALFKFVSSADPASCFGAGDETMGLAAKKSNCATGNETFQQVFPGMQSQLFLLSPSA
jgi:hypothetical protein